jgi:ectoine hydroxylase-related dioxygenase (phytanoyl-CoA dioxygenase family)
MWQGPTGTVEYLLNVMWPLTPFTADNGATLIWPESHGSAAPDDRRPLPHIVAACDPGDAIVFLGSTLHGAGANRTPLPRRGLIVSYCLGWLKPYENQWLAYPPAIARGFAPDLAALVGYRQHRPNLGNFEGQCPSVLLRDDGVGALGAVVALRPDQALMLGAFVAAQRKAADGA